MKFFIIFAVISILAILQAGFLSNFSILSSFNLLLVFSLSLALSSDSKQGLVAALLSGVILDFYSGLTDGLLTLSLVVTILTVRFVISIFLSPYSSRVILLSSVMLASVIFNLAVVFFAFLLEILPGFGQNLSLPYIFGQKIWLEILGSIILAYPMLWLCLKINKMNANESV